MDPLKAILDQLYNDSMADYLASPQQFFTLRKDPILFPHRYRNFHDIEASAFLAATFAYGNVTSLCAFVERLHSFLQPSPAAFLKQGARAVEDLERYQPYYRLHKTKEILSLLHMLSRVYSEYGSLYDLFKISYYGSSTMKMALIGFAGRLQSLSSEPIRFLVPSPAGGSPCKRLNLFLRWMVRRDGIDFGLWNEVSPADLIMPVDTHIGRIAHCFGWISTPSLSWQKAETITAVLRNFDPNDPTRYDFSLCHESISKSKWLFDRIYRKQAGKPATIHAGKDPGRSSPG